MNVISRWASDDARTAAGETPGRVVYSTASRIPRPDGSGNTTIPTTHASANAPVAPTIGVPGS